MIFSKLPFSGVAALQFHYAEGFNIARSPRLNR
jgi:hypothetical protein